MNKRNVKTLDTSNQSIDIYDKYLNYMDRLYNEIQTEGYKRQTELTSTDDFAGRHIHPNLNEIQVMIGRNGEFICNTGLHRLSIAKIQNIKKIPVRTQCRHERWQEIRGDLYTASSIEELPPSIRKYTDHPEMKDIAENINK